METSLVTDNVFQLSSCIRRVRHIQSLSVKNLSYHCEDVNQFESFFTLHSSSLKEFYKSETLTGTLNLSWKLVQMKHVPSHFTSPSTVCLRIWVREGELTPKVHIEYDLDLQCLVLYNSAVDSSSGIHIGSTTNKGNSDIITLGMFGATFTLPPADSIQSQREYLYLRTSHVPKLSYSSNQLARLQTVLRALRQTEQSIGNVKDSIERQMADRQSLTEKQEKMEAAQVRVHAIKARLEQKRQIAQAKRSRVNIKRSEGKGQEKDIDAIQRKMQVDDVHFTDVQSDYYNKRERLLKGNALLTKRQKQMVHELCLIYPIEQMVDGRYTIAGVYLPPADQVNGQNEMAASTALGYTGHLVLMLSRFLALPLEYPIDFQGSRSRIYDMARPTPLLPSQKDRTFPLYSRGKDKRLFQCAVFMLNKNVENLRYAHELYTKDIKSTLKNLKDFLHVKFGIGLTRQIQSQQEVRSPRLPIQRAASVPVLRHSSLIVADRKSSYGGNWARTGTDSSDEIHGRTGSIAVASAYEYGSPVVSDVAPLSGTPVSILDNSSCEVLTVDGETTFSQQEERNKTVCENDGTQDTSDAIEKSLPTLQEHIVDSPAVLNEKDASNCWAEGATAGNQEQVLNNQLTSGPVGAQMYNGNSQDAVDSNGVLVLKDGMKKLPLRDDETSENVTEKLSHELNVDSDQ